MDARFLYFIAHVRTYLSLLLRIDTPIITARCCRCPLLLATYLTSHKLVACYLSLCRETTKERARAFLSPISPKIKVQHSLDVLNGLLKRQRKTLPMCVRIDARAFGEFIPSVSAASRNKKDNMIFVSGFSLFCIY